MKQATSFSSIRGQRGDAILEALFGMVLMAVIGLGLSFASARATLSQRYLNTQNIVVSDMREQLMTANSIADLCDNQAQSGVQVGGTTSALELNCGKNDVGGNPQVAVSVCIDAEQNNGNDHGNDNNNDNNHNHNNNHVGSCTSSVSAVLPAGTLVTSLTLSTPANETTQGLIGGDGKIEVKL